MGSLFSVPLFQEPLWFSYYGPIHHSEASEALEAAIATHLQEIGAKSSIPIRNEIVTELIVPVALTKTPFSFPDSQTIKVSFATTSPGFVSLNAFQHETNNSNTIDDSFKFETSLKCEQIFPRPPGNEWILRFDFPSSTEKKSVSARIYILSIHSNSSIIISEDRLIIDGIMSTISPIFTQTDDSGDGFADGNCLLCCHAPATVITFPCRHCCMCRQCSETYSMKLSRCPLCRALIHELIVCSQHSIEKSQ